MIFCYIEWDRNLFTVYLMDVPQPPNPQTQLNPIEPRRLHYRCPGPYPGLLAAGAPGGVQQVVKGMADISLVYRALSIYIYMVDICKP